jgi:hypothetical protein
MAVKYKSSSNYSDTVQTYKYLDLYNPKLNINNLSQETYELEIENKFDRRPDLLAFELFKDANLWWVLVHYNRDLLKDPINDFRAGLNIVVPKKYSP